MPLTPMRTVVIVFCLLFWNVSLRADDALLRLPDMPLHDPYILAHEASRTYYLYTSNRPNISGTPGVGTMAYKSKDLLNWEKAKADS